MQSAVSEVPGLELLEELGRGARNLVYRGRRRDRVVAVKVPRSPEAGSLADYQREASLQARARGAGLPEVYEVGSHAGTPFLITELVEGESLSTRLQRSPLTGEEALRLAGELAVTLACIHDRGLVHRDLKPGNILLTESGAARLIDFGLATRSLLSQDGTVTGTFRYSAPEQTGMLDRPLDGRADLYALGVVLFECLTGCPPFTAEEPAELIRQHAVSAPPPLTCPGPPLLLAAIPRLLAKDPDDRPGSARQLLQLLGLPAPEPATTPLAGREQELLTLQYHWQEAQGGRGRMLLVTGEGGSGKSQLCQTFVRQTGGRFLRARCETSGKPFGLLHQLLEQWEPGFPGLGDALRTAAGPHAAVLAAFSPILAELLDTPPSEVSSGHYMQALSEVLVELAQRGPILLLLDDLQWIDASSWQILKRVLQRLSSTRCLILGTSRQPGLPDVDLETLPLQPLTARELDTLLDAALGPDHDPAMADQLMLASNGNPFVAVETLQAALDAGLFVPDWGGWRSAGEGLTRLELPGHVMNALVFRLEQLQPGPRRILQAGAVLGLRFPIDLLQRVVGEEVRLVLAEGARLRLLERVEEGELRFVHDRVREALLDELAPEERRELHRRASLALAEGDVYARAEHAWAGYEGPGPGVAEASWDAGRAALAQHAYAEACQYLERAARAGVSADAAFHEQLGDAAYHCGRLDLAADSYGQAQALQERGELYFKLTKIHLLEADTERAWPLVTAGLRHLGVPFSRSVPARVAYVSRHTPWLLAGRLGPESLGENTELASRLYLLAAQLSAYDARVLELCEFLIRGTRAAASLGPCPTLAILSSFHTIFLATVGLRGGARRLSQQARRIGEQLRDPVLSAQCEMYRAVALRVEGQEALSATRLTEILGRRGNWLPTFEYVAGGLDLAHNLHFRGLLEEARPWAEAKARRVVSEHFPMMVTCTLAAINAALGRSAESRKYLEICRQTVQSSRSPIRHTGYLVAGLHALFEMGELGSEAEEMIAAFHALGYTPLTAPFHPRSFYILEGHVRLRQCQTGSDQRVRLRAAIDRLRFASTIPLYATHLAVLEAAYQRLRGRRKQCRAWLARALELAHRHDNPWVRLEVSRQHAFLLREEGLLEPAAREAGLALAMARELGWVSQVYQLQREFALETADRRLASHSGGSQSALLVRLQRNLEALLQVTTAAANVLDTARLAHLTLQELVRILGAERAFLFLGEAEELTFHTGLDATGTVLTAPEDYASSVVRLVTDTGRTVLWNGSEEGRLLDSQSVRRHDLRSILAAPLKVRDRLLGVVYLDSRLARGVFGQDDVQLLHALANQIAVTLETARAARLEVQFRSEREQRLLAEQLGELVGSLLQHMDANQTLERLLDGLARVIGCDASCALRVREQALEPGPGRGELTVSQPDDWQALLRNNRPVREGTGPYRVWAPLRSHAASLGLVGLERSAPFTGGEIELVHTLTGYASMALENARLFSDVERLATTDELTGLHNRRHFFRQAEDELRRADRLQHDLCVVMFDVDHFKKFNDSYGHATGDAVLATTSARCRACLRTTDIVGRYGGEEFALVLVGTGLEAGVQTAERLRRAIADTPFATPQGEMSVHVSLGIAQRFLGETLEAALERADAALYQAKSEGRNRVVAAP